MVHLRNSIFIATGWFVTIFTISILPQNSFANSKLEYIAFISTKYDKANIPDHIYPEEKIYCFVEFLNLAPGKHKVSTTWITPDGKTERQDVGVIDKMVGEKAIYYSWIKLIEKSFAEQIVTGESYDQSYLGEWRVIIYLDDTSLREVTFLMAD